MFGIFPTNDRHYAKGIAGTSNVDVTVLVPI